MAGAVQDVHARLDGLWELRVGLHGFRDEVVVVDARMVVACSRHCSAHAAVQVDHPDRHLHTRTFTEALSQPKRQWPLMVQVPEMGTCQGSRLCAVALHSRCTDNEVASSPQAV